MSSLWGFSVHVHISPVLHLAPEDLGPGPETGLQTHSKDPLDLKEDRRFYFQSTLSPQRDCVNFRFQSLATKTCRGLTSMSSLLTQMGRLE